MLFNETCTTIQRRLLSSCHLRSHGLGPRAKGSSGGREVEALGGWVETRPWVVGCGSIRKGGRDCGPPGGPWGEAEEKLGLCTGGNVEDGGKEYELAKSP